jgi:hypothetical protein
MRFRSLALLALLALPASAHAQALRSFNDCSIASMSGSSQQLVATNPQRAYLLVCNTGASGDNIGVNFAGGTAAIAGAGTITLVPGSCKEYAAGSSYLPNPPSGVVNVIGTSSQPVACYEGR